MDILDRGFVGTKDLEAFQNLWLRQYVQSIQQLTAIRIDEEMADDLWSIRFDIIKEWQDWRFGHPSAGKDAMGMMSLGR